MAKKAKKKVAATADDGENGAKKTSPVKPVAIVGGAVALVLVIGVGVYASGLVHSLMGWDQARDKAEIEIGEPVFHPLPEIRTDMKTGACRSPFLRAVVHVQLAPEDLKRLQDTEDQVMDAILTHLRDQERQHVVGKAGSERLRFELVQIIDNIIRPAKVHTVLFKELIVQ